MPLSHVFIRAKVCVRKQSIVCLCVSVCVAVSVVSMVNRASVSPHLTLTSSHGECVCEFVCECVCECTRVCVYVGKRHSV